MVLTWNPVAGKVLHERALFGEAVAAKSGAMPDGPLPLSPDAHFAALSGSSSQAGTSLWDVTTGRVVCDFEWRTADANQLAAAFCADGRQLALTDGHLVRIWNIDTGHLRAALTCRTGGMPQQNPRVQLAGSADGRLVAVAVQMHTPEGAAAVRVALLDVVTRKQLTTVEVPGDDTDDDGTEFCDRSNLAFSPDSKLLARPGGKHVIALVRTDTGKERQRLTLGGKVGIITALAFAPDGRTLAVAAGGDRPVGPMGNLLAPRETRVQLWEIASGRLRAEFVGHTGVVPCLAFSPDCRTLASGGADTTILLWDAGGTHGQAPRTLTAQELTAAWTALAEPDAQAAFRAHRKLLGSPAETIAMVRKLLPPAKPSPVERGPDRRAVVAARRRQLRPPRPCFSHVGEDRPHGRASAAQGARGRQIARNASPHRRPARPYRPPHADARGAASDPRCRGAGAHRNRGGA